MSSLGDALVGGGAQTETAPKSAFGSNTSGFGSSGASAFGSSTGTSAFGSSAGKSSGFGSAGFGQTASPASSAFSAASAKKDLSSVAVEGIPENFIEVFKNEFFIPGSIPDVPPPAQLCQ